MSGWPKKASRESINNTHISARALLESSPEGALIVTSTTVEGLVVRVLVADDQTLFRTGLVSLLAADERVDVVGQARDGDEAVKQAILLKPDVVLMDLRMPNVDGIEATRRIVESLPGTRVLILTSFENDGEILQVLKAGASGYELKDASAGAIVNSILAVMSDKRVMAGAVANRVLAMLSGTLTSKEWYDGLTEREIEILKLLASGAANKEIAYRLRISEKTVRNHVSKIYEKLGVYDRTQAALYAVRKGLIEF